MNEKQAREEGLHFTGRYKRHHERSLVVEEAKRIRSLGFRAVTIEKDFGYSVYAEYSYFEAMDAHRKWQSAVNGLDGQLKKILDLRTELAKAESDYEEMKTLAAQPEPKKVE